MHNAERGDTAFAVLQTPYCAVVFDDQVRQSQFENGFYMERGTPVTLVDLCSCDNASRVTPYSAIDADVQRDICDSGQSCEEWTAYVGYPYVGRKTSTTIGTAGLAQSNPAVSVDGARQICGLGFFRPSFMVPHYGSISYGCIVGGT